LQIFPNLITNDYKSHVVANEVVTFWLISTSGLWGCMCNVNMCITSYKWLCFMGSWKNSFIMTHGVGMKFNICWSVFKPLNSCDNTSQLYLHQINCDSVIHETCNCCLDYVGSLDSSFHEMYINFVLVNIH